MMQNNAQSRGWWVARTDRARCSTLYGVALRCGLDVECDYAAAYRLDCFFTAGADDRVQ